MGPYKLVISITLLQVCFLVSVGVLAVGDGHPVRSARVGEFLDRLLVPVRGQRKLVSHTVLDDGWLSCAEIYDLHLDTVADLLTLRHIVPPFAVDRDRVEEVLVQMANNASKSQSLPSIRVRSP